MNFRYSSYLWFGGLLLLLVVLRISGTNTLGANEVVTVASNRTIISPSEVFELGFFKLTLERTRWYLGIWYKRIPERSYVWIANRDNPLLNSSGTLKFSNSNLVLLGDNKSDVPTWSTKNIPHSQSSLVAELLDNGNFVIRDSVNNNPEEFLWQSFDYPTDTLLPGMKLLWDKKKEIRRVLTSWKNHDDPSRGEYTYGIGTGELPQTIVYKEGEGGGGDVTEYRVWSVVTHVITHNVAVDFTATEDEQTYFFTVKDVQEYSRFQLTVGGSIILYTVPRTSLLWISPWMFPAAYCDDSVACTNNAVCSDVKANECKCLKGLIVDHGYCFRKTALTCGQNQDVGFMRVKRMKLPDTETATVNNTIDSKECQRRCRENCDCTAYLYLPMRNGRSACVNWKQEPSELQLLDKGLDLYFKLAAQDFEDKNTSKGKIIGPVVGTTVFIIICAAAAVTFYYWKKRTNYESSSAGGRELLPLGGAEQDFNLPQIEFSEIVNATEHFSVANKLGQGGFGAVYKGTLHDGTKIAAKRLTRMTMEGTNQFVNEVNLIAKLQHINLVRVLGYCIDSQGGFLLIYEYMENLSLDSHLFGNSQNPPLSWQSRYNIAKGIARGMQYLHQDSDFRIIHRDLKVSNILLDENMVPKISDFGMARLIERDENELNTVAVVGTMGYMAPEYTRDGTFSPKSDVYSFGILLLEIICGKKNWGYTNTNGDAGLLNCVWKSWKDSNLDEVVDPHITLSLQVIRALQIGLLCAQERAQDRPEMYIVVLMLESEEPVPNPSQPTPYTTYDVGSTSSASGSTISWSHWAAKVGRAAPR